jgi:hypothetical protein
VGKSSVSVPAFRSLDQDVEQYGAELKEVRWGMRTKVGWFGTSKRGIFLS